MRKARGFKPTNRVEAVAIKLAEQDVLFLNASHYQTAKAVLKAADDFDSVRGVRRIDTTLGRRATLTAAHPACADCGKCRVVENEDWCGQCEYRSCERGIDCVEAPTDQAKLIAAVEAVESLASRTVNAPIEYSAGYLAQDILAALTQALGGDTA